MTADKAIGKVQDDHKAGILGIKFLIYEMNREGLHQNPNSDQIDMIGYDPEFLPMNFPSWKPLVKKKQMKRLPLFKVRAYIFQCRDLPAADSDGTSDPAVQIHGDGSTGNDVKDWTSVIEDNMNPLFYETLTFTVEALGID
jgi:hypothetical protein